MGELRVVIEGFWRRENEGEEVEMEAEMDAIFVFFFFSWFAGTSRFGNGDLNSKIEGFSLCFYIKVYMIFDRFIELYAMQPHKMDYMDWTSSLVDH